MISYRAKKAFTLVELLIVIIIIGVIAGGLWLAMGPSDASAKKAACLGNKESIKTAWSFHSFANSLPGDFAKYVNDGEYKNEVDRVTGCPSGGEYTATSEDAGDITRYTIHCKYHDDSTLNISNGGGTVADGGSGTVTPPETGGSEEEENSEEKENKEAWDSIAGTITPPIDKSNSQSGNVKIDLIKGNTVTFDGVTYTVTKNVNDLQFKDKNYPNLFQDLKESYDKKSSDGIKTWLKLCKDYLTPTPNL